MECGLVIGLLLLMLLIQQFFWMRQVQKLVDKLMSRNYAEYSAAQMPVVAPRIKVEDSEPKEDFGVLSGIGIP